MNKKVLSAGLCASLILGAYTSADASETKMSKETPITSDESKREEHDYLFEVIEIADKKVKLSYAGEDIEDSIQTDLKRDKTLSIDKNLFEENIEEKDLYKITSKKELKNLDKDSIKKDDIKLITKYEKPVNMESEKLPKDTQNGIFEVKSVSDDQANPTATIFEVGNPENVFTLSYDDLREESPKVGDQYKIYWDGIVMESYPAQFGKIYRVEKDDNINSEDSEADEKMDQTLEFEVIELNDGVATIAEVGNKDNLYTIGFKELGDKDPQVGDSYKIHWNGISMKSYPAQFGEIYDVEKLSKESKTNKDDLKKAIDEAGKIDLDDKSYKSEDIDIFNQAYDEAIRVDKDSSASQEAIDNAKENLRKAIDSLKSKDQVVKREYILKDIREDGSKNAVLVAADDKEGQEYTVSFETLNDPDARVGDHYMITMEGINPDADPAEFGNITNIEKLSKNDTDTSDKDNQKVINNKDENQASKTIEAKKIEDNAKKNESPKFGFTNPSTGIGSVAPFAGIIALAGVILKKTKR